MNDVTEQAIDWVIGGAEPAERAALALRVADDPALAAEVGALEQDLAGLAAAGADVAPDPELWSRIAVAMDPGPGGTLLHRRAEGDWIEASPGVRTKTLWDRNTLLVEIAPGAPVPPHPHPMIEHCVVLEGALHVEGVPVRPGDYHAVPRGVPHEAVTAPDGALLLIRYGD